MAYTGTTNLTITPSFTLNVTCLVAPANRLFSFAFEAQRREMTSHSEGSRGARTLTNDSQGEGCI